MFMIDERSGVLYKMEKSVATVGDTIYDFKHLRKDTVISSDKHCIRVKDPIKPLPLLHDQYVILKPVAE